MNLAYSEPWARLAPSACLDARFAYAERVIDFAERAFPGLRDGAFHARHPAVAFRIAYHGIDGLLDDHISVEKPIDTDDLTAGALQLLHRALGHPDHTPAAARKSTTIKNTRKRSKR